MLTGRSSLQPKRHRDQRKAGTQLDGFDRLTVAVTARRMMQRRRTAFEH